MEGGFSCDLGDGPMVEGWRVEGGGWRVDEGTALTLCCCAPRRATPARQAGVGEVGTVCDGDGVEMMEECAVSCREDEEDVGSAAWARGLGARQEVRQCEDRKGQGPAAPAVPQSHCRRFRRRHSRSGGERGSRLTETWTRLRPSQRRLPYGYSVECVDTWILDKRNRAIRKGGRRECPCRRVDGRGTQLSSCWANQPAPPGGCGGRWAEL